MPYRDSKLTRLLQGAPLSSAVVLLLVYLHCLVVDSLGGNAKTCMVTTIVSYIGFGVMWLSRQPIY